MRQGVAVLAAFVMVCTGSTLLGQSQPSLSRLITITGVFHPADGQPIAPAEGVTLAVYAEEEGGVPLWQETQTIAVDPSGRYSVLLGAAHADGVPLDLFTGGAARWLGTQFARPGEVESRRVRLTSVPYALHAADAETLGGRPASAYLLAPTEGDAPQSAGQAVAARGEVSPQAVLPGTMNFLSKYVNGADVGNSAVFESGGLVGVGTTTPLDVINARFTNTGGTMTGFAVQNLGTTANSYSGMLFYDQNGDLGQFQGFNNSTHEYRINNIGRASPGGAFNGSINFMIGGTSRFFTNTSGAIGLSTTAPVGMLHVTNANSPHVGGILVTDYGGGSIPFPYVHTWAARGTAAAPSQVLSGDLLAFFGGGGYYSGTPGNFFSGSVGIQVRASQNWTFNSLGAHLDFVTSPNGSSLSAGSLRMRIHADGNVGIATATSVPTDRLQVVGDIRVGTAGTNGCVKGFDAAPIAGVCASDLRFKKDVRPFDPLLGSLTALQPVHYFWRAAEFPDRHFGDRRSYGLIAQDVERVLPELVVTGADGYKAVDYSKIPLLTLQAVKELKAENDAVKERNEALEARVLELEQRMKDLLAEVKRR